MSEVIDQSGTLSNLIDLSVGEQIVIQHDSASTGAVVVTLDSALGVEALDTFTVQDDATLVAASTLAVGILNEFVIGQDGTLEQAAGLAVSVLSDVSFQSGTSGGDLILAQGVSLSLLSGVSGFTHGDTIDLQGIGSPVSYSDTYTPGLLGVGAGTNFTITTSSGVETFQLQGNLTGDTFSLASDGQGGVELINAPCFCEGTLIRTSTREIPVEQLEIGDMVQTHSGAARRIKWIGNRSYDGKFIEGNHLMLPVCIQANAIADGIPARDLHVSPGHAIYCAGALVPAWRLLNGVTITQAEHVESVTYFHVELENHDVIFAENCPTESFLDEGFRGQFLNAAEYKDLYPNEDSAPGIARTESGYLLASIQRHLAARAGVFLPDTQTGALHGFVDQAGPVIVSGWAQNIDAPEAPVSLDIWHGDRRVARVLANVYRADLRKAGLGSGCHGFEVSLPAGLTGAIEVRRSPDRMSLKLTKNAMSHAA